LQPELQPLADVVLFAEYIAVTLGFGNGVYDAPSAAMHDLVLSRGEAYGISGAILTDLSADVADGLQAEGWLELADSVQ